MTAHIADTSSVRFSPALLVAATVASAFAFGHPSAAAPGPPLDLRRIHVAEQAAYAPLPSSRASVRLTLDPAWQRAAERLLGRSGAAEAAVVASDVRTGRILVWASRGDRDYVTAAFAPSASLFKIVTAAALLESGRVTTATEVCYAGGEHAITPADLRARGTACVPLREALGKSINLVFARLAQKHLSAGDLRRTAKELGFAGQVPIDVPGAASVVDIPDDAFGLARAAAGFWNGRLSPLGALFAMQTIANSGERIRLSVIDHAAPTARISEGRALPAKVATALGQMLEVTTRRGTCARVFRQAGASSAIAGIRVAAKTGTLVGNHPARMFSWFTAFAPADRPEVAITVMLANPLQWRTKANVVGRELLEAYFQPKEPDRARSARR